MEQRVLQEAGFADIFIRRPVLAVSICLLMVFAGIKAARDMPVSQFPQIESSSLVVSTQFVGASAEVVKGFVTDPIERAASSVPGVDYIDSTTTAGYSLVTIWLKLNEDSTVALAELSARLDQIRFELPRDAYDPAIQVSRADRPHAGFYLPVLLTEEMSRSGATDYLGRHVLSVLGAIPGVQKVGIVGGRYPAMRVWLSSKLMNTYDLSAVDVEAALRANNVIATIGRTENAQQRMDLLANTGLQTVDDFESLVVRATGSMVLRLRDIARVELGEEEGSENARFSQNRSLFISVWPLPGANEIAIADRLYEAVERLNQNTPDGLQIIEGYDITLYMRSALKEIFITLAETICLVGLVVFAFMGSIRTAFVPLITIPISLLGALAAMSLLGFSLNLLTVLAIVLSVGLVVDDAIVVVENVARFMRSGMSRTEAAMKSSRQLLAPITAMTLTLAVVYAPIGFLSGLTGALFKEFAFTLAVAVLISGFVAVTLSPIMSAYVCPEGGQEGALARRVNALFDRCQQSYMQCLSVTLAHTSKVGFVGIFFLLLMVPLYLFSMHELAPVEDTSSISVITSAPPEASLDYTTRHMYNVVDALAALPDRTKMWQVVLPTGSFAGQDFVGHDDRELSVHEMLPQAFGQLSGVAPLKSFPTLQAALPTAGNFDVEVVVQSTDEPHVMMRHANALLQAARDSRAFIYVDTDLRIDLPQVHFRIDRDQAADLGFTMQEVARQLSVPLSGSYVNRFDYDGKAYQVIPMFAEDQRANPEQLLEVNVRSPDGVLVSLSAIATLEYAAAPRFLTRFEQKNAFKVFAAVIPGTTKDRGLQALERAAKDTLPASYSVDYVGESRQIRAEGNTLTGVLGVALVVVFLVLAVQFNSFRDPFIVLLGSVPLAFSGALLFTFLGLTTINIYSQVGLITLVGLVSKNAILIVEFANHLQRAGLTRLDAIKEGAAIRLRPVLMTTGATVLGHFPLVLVSGAGAEARNSIGIILVAGMMIGTLFTLFVLPTVYLAVSSDHRNENAVGDVTS